MQFLFELIANIIHCQITSQQVALWLYNYKADYVVWREGYIQRVFCSKIYKHV